MEVSLKHRRVSSFRIVLYLVLVMAMLLSACTPASPTAEAPAQEAAPAATEAPKAEEAAPAAAPTEAPVAETDPMMTPFGVALPDDALPYDEQVYTQPCSNTANQTTFDFMVAVYQRYCAGDSAFSLALVDLDKDFNVIPMAAESWEASDDGLTWTFHLRPGMIWSDDTPV
ncbi:MAG: ABC transporter substrate-binding protein, partial [Caldilineaceae bacterium]